MVEIPTEEIKLTAYPPRISAYTKLPATHPFYATLGRVTSEWAHLEHALDEIIWKLAQFDRKTASCVTGQMMGHWPRINSIMALAAARGIKESAIKKVEHFGNTITGLAKQRNRFVHDAWFSDLGNKAVAQFVCFSAKDQRFGIHDIDTAAADLLISSITKKVNECWDLREALLAAIPPSEETPP